MNSNSSVCREMRGEETRGDGGWHASPSLRPQSLAAPWQAAVQYIDMQCITQQTQTRWIRHRHGGLSYHLPADQEGMAGSSIVVLLIQQNCMYMQYRKQRQQTQLNTVLCVYTILINLYLCVYAILYQTRYSFSLFVYKNTFRYPHQIRCIDTLSR